MAFHTNGYKAVINGEEIMLYPVGRLVASLKEVGYPRSAQTIRLWERKGITPKSKYILRGKRMYTAEHIKAFVDIIQECDVIQGVPIETTDFSEKIWEALGNEATEVLQ